MNWNESYECEKAVLAYDDQLDIIFNKSEEDDIGREPHFFSYIDQDAVPALLMSYGNSHPEGICVYKYDLNTNKVVYLGEYGSFGRFSYYDKCSLIKSYYGNTGCYTYYISKICDDNTVDLFDYWIVDGGGIKNDDTMYYHGYDLSPEAYGINGSRESFEILGLDELCAYGAEIEKYTISEEEYLKTVYDWIGTSEDKEITVEYDDMYSIKHD